MTDEKKHSQLARLRFAVDGLLQAWKQEASFRTEVVILAMALGFTAWLRPSSVWWAVIAIPAAIILMAELINTAIENVCDALHPNSHPLIGAAKDCASAAVLIANVLGLSLFVWMVISQWK